MPKKKAEKKVVKKKVNKEQEELVKKYKKVFEKVVNVVESEKNIGIVYQVLVDIITQIEQQYGVKSKKCDSCTDCSC